MDESNGNGETPASGSAAGNGETAAADGTPASGSAADADGRTVTVRVVGEGTREVTLAADATCADLLGAVDLSPHTATALVDGRPVPVDAPVPDGEVRVLRLVKGG